MDELRKEFLLQEPRMTFGPRASYWKITGGEKRVPGVHDSWKYHEAFESTQRPATQAEVNKIY